MMTADYPDWLNPMLVKELRQGLCKGTFTAGFILLQVIMLLFLGIRLLTDAAEDYREIGGYLDGILTGGLCFIMLFLMPIRSLTAIQEEQKIQTLELVQMTWMGSMKIVWGKWAAVMSQAMLFLVAVLPYGVLRYFFGGMEIEESLIGLAKLILTSMLLTAFGVWLSTMSAAIRGVAVFVVYIAVQTVVAGSFIGGGRYFFSSSASGLAMAYGTVITSLFVLTLAASRIGSVAENHSVVLRSLALIAGLVGWVGAGFGDPGWMLAGAPIMIWSIFEALTERTSEVPSMYAHWLRWGMPGRLACRVMNPGWATGLIYTLIIVVMILVVGISTKMNSGGPLTPDLVSGGLFYIALITPVCLICTRIGAKNRGLLYALVQGLAILLSVVASSFDAMVFGSRESNVGAVLIASHPSSAAFWLAAQTKLTKPMHMMYLTYITVPLCAVILFFLIFRAIREFKLMTKQEQKARASQQPA